MEKMKMKNASESVHLKLAEAEKELFQNQDSTDIRRRFNISYYLPLYRPTSTSQPKLQSNKDEYPITSTSQPMFQPNEEEYPNESNEAEM